MTLQCRVTCLLTILTACYSAIQVNSLCHNIRAIFYTLIYIVRERFLDENLRFIFTSLHRGNKNLSNSSCSSLSLKYDLETMQSTRVKIKVIITLS